MLRDLDLALLHKSLLAKLSKLGLLGLTDLPGSDGCEERLECAVKIFLANGEIPTQQTE